MFYKLTRIFVALSLITFMSWTNLYAIAEEELVPLISEGGEKIIICHATESASSPYQEIEVDLHAWNEGTSTHSGHPNDFVREGDACPGPEPVCDDADQDEICDEVDNCPSVANPDQADSDGNGVGNVCQVADPVCGNGQVETGEACDDGNVNDNDGCSSLCRTEEKPNDPPADPVCGNGKVETGEACDDGNVNDNDGCSSLCRTEEKPNDPPANPICGNNQVENGEACDDGNLLDNDGCNRSCQKEIQDKPPVVKTTTVSVGLVRNESAGGNPIVKAKWEMTNNKDGQGKYLGTDDSTTAGAQFLPSGKFEVNKTVTVCAVVTDPDGVADINGVYADIFYPTDIALGANHEANRQGCGQQHGNEFSLKKLSKEDGINLLCNNIKQNNYNLPTWNLGYDYNEVCLEDGELWKDTAYVYCGEHNLSYEDPAGSYRTLIVAQDKYGQDGFLENNFKYMQLTAFEVDFDNVFYGDVKLNTPKIISGDLTFSNNDGRPTVRNVGNTRLQLKIYQNDLGLGMTDNDWNVQLQSRIGSQASFKSYWPNAWTDLLKELDLSETNEMDFGIKVTKFPPTHSDVNYGGEMTIGAKWAEPLKCQPS